MSLRRAHSTNQRYHRRRKNARALPLDALNHGLIIDIAAAEILTERGIDVGIKDIGAEVSGDSEHFLSDDNHIGTYGATVYDIKIHKNAQILSDVSTQNGVIPMSYRYENANGNRFLALNVNTRSPKDTVLKHYARSKQYADNIPWLNGKKLPAYVYGNPALYIQCKRNEDALAVGL